jgi:hypothetical protein
MNRPNCEMNGTLPHPATRVLQTRAETKRREKSICIRCREHDALEYPVTAVNFVASVRTCKTERYLQWEAEQRRRRTVGGAINQQRGF